METTTIDQPIEARANGRSYKCKGCGGLVQIPDNLRKISLADVKRVHVPNCPGGAKLAAA